MPYGCMMGWDQGKCTRDDEAFVCPAGLADSHCSDVVSWQRHTAHMTVPQLWPRDVSVLVLAYVGTGVGARFAAKCSRQLWPAELKHHTWGLSNQHPRSSSAALLQVTPRLA